jgi:hypothetical protein
MRKMALLVLGTLLMASNVYAGNAALDPTALANTILNMHKSSVAEKGSFAIVYGGQDISRSTNSRIDHPVLIG